MTAPAAQAYGYAHRGSVVGPSELDGYWMVRCSAVNPLRPIGPYASTVPDLAIDDRVLLTQIGTSRDDLVITGKLPAVPWDANLPIDIGDVTGLQAALDARATDAELSAAVAVLNAADATQDGRLTAVEGVNTTQNTRLTAAEGVNTTQDGRLTSAEGRLTANEASIGTHTTGIAANTTAIGNLTTYAWGNQEHETDSYGDQISAFRRNEIQNGRTLTANGGLGFRTRSRRALSVSQMRVICTAAGVGAGTTTAGLYKANTQAGPFTLAAQATNALGTLGEAAFTLGATAIAAGEWLVLFLRAAGYTTFPGIGTVANQVRNGAHNPNTARAAFPTRTTSGALPTTIDIADGSWGIADPTPWWFALA